MKHNKKRNTAFIYETLTRAFTKAIVEKNLDRKNEIMPILKEFFTPGKLLAQELDLYRILLETTNTQPKIAERLLHETKVAYAQLDENALFDTQSKLISAMNKNLGQEIWSTFVPNFKSLASVNAIFTNKTSVKKRVLFEQAVVDRMSSINENALSERLEALDSITYNSFIQKFNNKYHSLLKEQKDLLNRYITSFADDGFELRLYLNEELSRLKGVIERTEDPDFEPLIVKKSQEVLAYLEEFRKRDFTEADLSKVLKTQELVKELRPND
jgi:hypothetical protein